MFNDRQGATASMFPTSETENLCMMVTGIGSKQFSVLMTDTIPDVQMQFNGQCFPLHVFSEDRFDDGLFAAGSSSVLRKSDTLSDAVLNSFREFYSSPSISKDDLFFYVYGVLHSPEFRDRFQNNLLKEIARVPRVRTFDGFRSFSIAGKKLSDLHVGFEKVTPYPVSFKQGDLKLAHIEDPTSFFRVEKMRFAGTRESSDKSTVIYNQNVTITNIPSSAYDYIVNGKSALEWVMERQSIKTDKDSGIQNDANEFANMTMKNPAYPLELFQRVITVSVETLKIVSELPKLDLAH